jgi:hypothetical protein
VGDSAHVVGRATMFFVTIGKVGSTGLFVRSMNFPDAGRGGPWSGGGRQRKHAGGKASPHTRGGTGGPLSVGQGRRHQAFGIRHWGGSEGIISLCPIASCLMPNP